MKCPKCGYLGYQDVERCRNCGYEFSLAPSGAGELRIRQTEPEPEALGDLDLIDSRMAAAALNALRAAAGKTPSEPLAAPVDSKDPGELPLFGDAAPDDEPLITKASPPRPPLAVRRSTPEVPRLRSESRMPVNEAPVVTSLAPIGQKPAAKPKVAPPTPAPSVAPPTPVPPTPAAAAPVAAPPTPPRPTPAPPTPPPAPRVARPAPTPLPPEPPLVEERPVSAPFAVVRPATAGERVTAAAIDLVLLLCVDLLVVYFALKVCRLAPSEYRLLPPVPTIAFLLLQNGGYLVAFTTVGQTLGKMLTGLRVVDVETDASPGFGRAAARAALTLLFTLPAGLGLLPVLFNHDGRGLQDRLAGTRVVHGTD
ncbi:MAG: RDD family protein [Vicinamibacterales bacterium]